MYNNDTGISYAKKIKEKLSKNHKEGDQEIITGFMLQMLDMNKKPHYLCPIHSYENYIWHLNPKIDALWQRPFNKIPKSGNVWYAVTVLGHNPIEKFMSKLSGICSLIDYYTNHCICVMGATNLTRSNFTAKQGMSVTGHKSVQSLAIYQKVREWMTNYLWASA